MTDEQQVEFAGTAPSTYAHNATPESAAADPATEHITEQAATSSTQEATSAAQNVPISASVPEPPEHQAIPSSDAALSQHSTVAASPASAKQPDYDVEAIYPEIVAAKNNKTTLEVTGLRRVRGGILVSYKGMPLFLPTSHLSLKANPSENELLALIQQTFPVHVHEINDNDKTKVIVTRRKLLRADQLKEFHVGQIVEGKVVSFTEFGAFINLGTVDGMVHVSAISRRRINHPSEVLKKGDTVRAVVKEINEAGQRLSLSMRELEPDPWQGAAAEFPVGTIHKGKVKSLTPFGAYIELRPGIEGLIHISEMSWARRIKHPSELFQVGQEIDVYILDISEEKQKVSLGYKQTQPNPWETITERFKVGDRVEGTVRESIDRGVVVNIAEDIDAFMPKGKMHPSLRNKAHPFKVGDKIDGLFIMDIVPENHSLILGMEGFDQSPGKNEREQRRARSQQEQTTLEQKADVSLADLLSDDEKRKLFGTGE
ncbi:MAG: S1 RNA-binding domain-containing protein [Bacteroidota bacterium]|nr:S1 RNA-binding domain-containing protein [Candidatus Kapabacteria bacterium]MDW8219346.1 S1 RNA-binding domain-containing protein [Bacteroidota bacterium]